MAEGTRSLGRLEDALHPAEYTDSQCCCQCLQESFSMARSSSLASGCQSLRHQAQFRHSQFMYHCMFEGFKMGIVIAASDAHVWRTLLSNSRGISYGFCFSH